MRTDIPTQADILKSRDGVRARYELRLQSGGETVTTFDSTYRTISDDPGIVAEPIPQDVALIDGIAVSVMSHSGVIKLQECFGAVVTTAIATDGISRPSIIDYGLGMAQIAYVSDAGVVRTVLFNKELFLGQHILDISSDQEVTGVPASGAYALHLIAPNDLVIFYIDDGGIKVYSTLYDKSSNPMYHPTYTYTVATDDHKLNYSGACRFNDTIFAYFSMYNGSVQAVKMIEDAELWSDMYEAVAADLSEFKISKANTYNGKVILSGQFNRVDDTGAFDSPYIYGMVLSSSDGDIFAIDRHSLFSFGNEDDSDDGARRFFAMGVDAPDSRYGMGGPAFVYYGGGTLAIGKCKYTVASQQYTTTILKLSSLGGSYNDGWMMKAGNMPIDQYELIKLGDAADIYIAVPDDQGAWTNWFMLQHGVITRKSRSEEDGKITTDLEFEPWGASRLNDMTWPYYVELQGKQSIRDDCDEWDNLYRASEDGFLIGQFYADFFGEATCGPQEAAASSTTEYTTPDLASTYYLVSNPVIEVNEFTIKCYGWSRPGHTVNLETGGETEPGDSNAENCHVSVRLYLKRGQDSVITTITNLANLAETAHFPRTFLTTAAGYYPVTLKAEVGVDNIQLNDIIEKVGMVFTNPNAGDATLNFPERIEIPEIGMHFYSFEDTWQTVEVEPFQTRWNFANGAGDWAETSTFRGGDPLHNMVGMICNHGSSMVFDCGDPGAAPGAGVQPPTGCGWGGGWWPGTPATRLEYIPQSGLLTTASASIRATANIINGGDTYVTVHYTDLSYSNHRVNYGASQNGVELTWDVAEADVGKEVAAFGICFCARYCLMHLLTLELDGFEFRDMEESDTGQELQASGIPVIYFSQKPYYTINCEVAAKWVLVGTDAWGGVVALAKDAQNYICARMSTTDLELVKYRAGIETVLATVAHAHSATYGEWIKLKVRDGYFSVRTRPDRETDWSEVLLEYYWQESDGNLIVEQDISHVGIYAYKNAPFFRTTGFDIAQGNVIGVLPPGEQFDDFPSSGTIKIEDCLYTYTGKQVAGDYMGPYQGRNTTQYDNYSNDGASYSGTAIEFTKFEFLDNDSHKQDYDDYYMAVESGFAWLCSSTDFKPWITTHDNRINLRNRGRYFSPQATGDQVGMSTRVWLTNALTGIARVSGADTSHSTGCLVYLNNTTSVRLFEFAASSGHGPLTDKDMIKIVCQLSDAEPRFPGDNEIDTMTLSGTPQQVSI